MDYHSEHVFYAWLKLIILSVPVIQIKFIDYLLAMFDW